MDSSRGTLELGARPVRTPGAIAVIGALVVAASGVRGADYPAQFLRAELWNRTGNAVWNFTWYGGHSTPNYSVLAPALSAWIGPVGVNVLATVVATYLFSQLVQGLVPAATPARARTLAGIAFAATALVNVVVGRTPFALGMAVGLAALWAWQRRWPVAATALALLTPLCSPVVGAFVALLVAAVGVDALLDRRWRTVGEATAVIAGATLPLGVMTLLFTDAGRFPFRFDQLLITLGLMAITAHAYRHRVVHLGLAMAAISSVVLFLVPNPLGGNFARFTQFVVVPVAVLGLPTIARRWQRWAGVAVLAGVVWGVQFGVTAATQWIGDDSVEAAFHEPLINAISVRSQGAVGRLEIPFTDNHWEAFYVATEVPYARGWERQADLERNPELYDPELTAGEYHTWLQDNAVRWVAVPDVDLDEGGAPEAGVLAGYRELDWLDLVWSNGDWRLFEVLDYTPLIDAPAELVRQGVDSLVVRTPRPAEVTLRYEFSEDLRIDGSACLLARASDDWITVVLPAAGTYTLSADPEALLPGAEHDLCIDD